MHLELCNYRIWMRDLLCGSSKILVHISNNMVRCVHVSRLEGPASAPLLLPLMCFAQKVTFYNVNILINIAFFLQKQSS